MNNKNNELLFSLLSCYLDSDSFGISPQQVKPLSHHDISTLISLDYCFKFNDMLFVNFESPDVFKAKLQTDRTRIEQISVASRLVQIKNELKLSLGSNLYSLVLIGSHARKTAQLHSDLDLIVISEKKIPKEVLQTLQTAALECELIYFTPQDFLTAAQEGQEFSLWALKYGLILFDKNFLQRCFPSKTINLELAIIRKKELIAKQLYKLKLALSNNRTHLIERRFYLIEQQLIRLDILKQGKIPKSSPELKKQLASYDHRFKKHVNVVKDFLATKKFLDAYQFLVDWYRWPAR